jgi:hypothetical protein
MLWLQYTVQAGHWPQLSLLNFTFEHFQPKQATLATGFLELVKRIRPSRAPPLLDVNAFAGPAVQTGLEGIRGRKKPEKKSDRHQQSAQET